jgi:threonine dehydratase
MKREVSPPTFRDVLRARQVIQAHLPRTPIHRYPGLDRLLDARVYVKHENYQPIGAFKVRGGIYLMSRLAADRIRGVITASTGNHGQSIAYAAALFGIRAVIVIPEHANPVKVEAMRSYGAEIRVHGKDFDDARSYCEQVSEEEELRYISSGDEPDLIAGVATETLEILDAQPDVDAIFVPVGGGSGAAGACLVAKTADARIRVIGVQSAAAPAAYLTWKNRRATEATMGTLAEGLATRRPFMLPQQMMWEGLDDFVLVEDTELQDGVRLYLEKAKTLAEPAGAAALAGALKLRDQCKGKAIALVLSGGNISFEQLRQCLDR